MKHAVIEIARRSLPLMNPTHRAEAERIINSFERTANTGDDDELSLFHDRAAAAWERDMAPVRDAMVAALHDGTREALERLRARTPDLLDQVNADPELAGVLSRQLLRVAAASLGDGSGGQTTAEAAVPGTSGGRRMGETTGNALTASVEQWRGREIFPTEFSSRDLRGLSSELHLRSIFSARTTNADYLNELGKVVDEILDGRINHATGRWMLMKKLKQLGYDPETGFPQDMAAVPPAERGTLRDLSSEQRIDLMLKTNVATARNYAHVVEGNTEFARYAFPAWELIRLEWRHTPRGTPDSHTVGWLERWHEAGASVGYEGASKSTMVALKDSPIWQALGDGAGGHDDALGRPFPPFAFNSGMDWQAVPRKEVESLGLIVDSQSSGPMKASLAPGKGEVQAALDRLGPEFHKSLLKELEDLAA